MWSFQLQSQLSIIWSVLVRICSQGWQSDCVEIVSSSRFEPGHCISHSKHEISVGLCAAAGLGFGSWIWIFVRHIRRDFFFRNGFYLYLVYMHGLKLGILPTCVSLFRGYVLVLILSKIAIGVSASSATHFWGSLLTSLLAVWGFSCANAHKECEWQPIRCQLVALCEPSGVVAFIRHVKHLQWSVWVVDQHV